MNIKWSYALIAVIYLMVIVLRFINTRCEAEFKEKHSDAKKVFIIKRDFFTTVTLICILVTVGINLAAIVGGKALNTSSMFVTLLVIGFTIINSCYYMFVSESSNEVLFVGYELKKDDIEKLKVKEKKNSMIFNMTFTKEIDSYNYAKVMSFGSNKLLLKEVLEKLVSNKESKADGAKEV